VLELFSRKRLKIQVMCVWWGRGVKKRGIYRGWAVVLYF
jgi:hypothetical protein